MAGKCEVPYSILVGDCRESMRSLPAGYFHCAVTSPPYWGLRDYGVDGQLGLEETPEAFVAGMVEVFREVKRVLRDDGTLWLNIGDSYAGGKVGRADNDRVDAGGFHGGTKGAGLPYQQRDVPPGLKPKDLCGIPWRLAFALQADGWYLRSDIIWHKPSPMPESVTDRPTKAHEYLFLLTKRDRYFYDAQAILEPCSPNTNARVSQNVAAQMGSERAHAGGKTNGTMKAVVRGSNRKFADDDSGTKSNESFANATALAVNERNRRTVWTIGTQGYSEAHFATYPEKLVEPCIMAGSSEKGCCAECGAPYRRVTERAALKRHRPNDLTKRTGENGTGNHCPNTVAGVSVRTMGWEHGCKCFRPDPVPCRVLDPFNGSGTTGAVALKLGREYVGCELNPEYAAMAHRRIGRAMKPETFRDETRVEDAGLFLRLPEGEGV